MSTEKHGRRVAVWMSAGTVGGIAALASYTHMTDLATRYGQAALIAHLLPLSVDGMMIVATVALGDGRRHRWSAWLAFWTGVAASVVANVLAAQPSLVARAISAWPAIAFLLVVEVITRGGRRASAVVALDDDDQDDEDDEDEPATDPWEYAEPVTELAGRGTGDASDVRTRRRSEKAARIARAHARTPAATDEEIARRVGASVRTVQRHRRDLRAAAGAPQQAARPEPVNGHRVPVLVTTSTEEE